MSERAAHQCHKDGCDSEARYLTKFQVDCFAPGLRQTVKMNCSIQVCEKHRSEQDVRAYILNDRNRETIITTLMEDGYAEPDFLTAKVEFEPIKQPAILLAMPPAKCDRGECGKPAKWQIKQRFRMLWQRGRGEPQIEVLTNLCVCDTHKDVVRPADFKDKDSESATRAWLNSRGVSLPDFKTMQIGFVPIDGKRVEPRVFVGDDGPLDQFAR